MNTTHLKRAAMSNAIIDDFAKYLADSLENFSPDGKNATTDSSGDWIIRVLLTNSSHEDY